MSGSQELVGLWEKTQHIPRYIIEMLAAAKPNRLGGSLFATDLVTFLHFKVIHHKSDNPILQGRDRFT